MKTKIAIIMGSETDLKTMSPAAKVLEDFRVPYEVRIVSAHRTPEAMVEFAKSARERGFAVVIAGAGGAAHLPGMVASLTTLPVIGVPVTVGKLNGLDALLSIAQMPKGVPVATVAVNNAANAALLALRMLGIHEEKIAKKLDRFRKKQVTVVKEMNSRVRKTKKVPTDF